MLLLTICALLLGAIVWWCKPKFFSSHYFPLGIGYRWVYTDQFAYTETRGIHQAAEQTTPDIVFEVIGVEKVGDAECCVVLRSIGNHEVKFYVQVTDSGVLLHQVGEDRYDPPYLQFKFYTQKGESWNWKGAFGGVEGEFQCVNHGESQVSCLMGQFDSFCIEQYADRDLGANVEFQLVEEIGVVHLRSKGRDKHDPPDLPAHFNWYLKKFTRP